MPKAYIAVIAVFLNHHHQLRFFGEFASEAACHHFGMMEARPLLNRGAEVIVTCPTLEDLRAQRPAVWIEEPAT